MKILKEGHKYELESFDPGLDDAQIIQFIEKELLRDGNDNGLLTTVCNGTTNEEVLKALIDRMQYLNEKHFCRENYIVITKLEEALMWLEKRTAAWRYKRYG